MSSSAFLPHIEIAISGNVPIRFVSTSCNELTSLPTLETLASLRDRIKKAAADDHWTAASAWNTNYRGVIGLVAMSPVGFGMLG